MVSFGMWTGDPVLLAIVTVFLRPYNMALHCFVTCQILIDFRHVSFWSLAFKMSSPYLCETRCPPRPYQSLGCNSSWRLGMDRVRRNRLMIDIKLILCMLCALCLWGFHENTSLCVLWFCYILARFQCLRRAPSSLVEWWWVLTI